MKIDRAWLQTGRAAPWVLAALVLAVTFAHLLMTAVVGQNMADPDAAAKIKKIEAAYVTEMRLSRPPVARAAPPAPAAGKPAKPRPKRKPRVVADAASAASAPEAAASEALVAESPASAASAPGDVPPVAAGPDLGASAPEAFVPPAASQPPPAMASAQKPGSAAQTPKEADAKAPTFVWPKATRVRYKLQGYYRGPIYGQSSVEWLREDKRYQVFIEASVGPSFAPLGSWRLSSEGEIRPEGLYPRRYENFNRIAIRSAPVQSLQLDDDTITLVNGNKVPRTPDMQDPASQFVQLAYRFIMNPSLLTPGNTVTMTMVLLKRTETLAYDVLNEEMLSTPLGEIRTVHVRPRRTEGDANNMTAEIWFAPELQYLPVRILMRTDAKTYLDMQMDRAPQQIEGDAVPTSAPTPGR
jgi:Protein of unknown function (DUF3108)